MQLRALTITIFIVALLSGCASNPVQEYKEFLGASEEREVTTVSGAVGKVHGTPLQKGESVSFEIDIDDPKMDLDGVRSFYELFEVPDISESTIEIKTLSHVTARAGGFGPMYLVWPRVFILDGSGKVLSDAPVKGKVGRAAFGFGPVRYEATWQAAIPARGTYYVLVTSDNRVLNERVASETMIIPAGALFVPWSFGFHARSIGNMSMEWK